MYKITKCIKTMHVLFCVNQTYIPFYLSYKSDLVQSSERFSLFCCLINMYDRQQEY